MKRIINFNGRVGRYDVPYFLFLENEHLEIVLDLPTYALGKYIAVLTCGKRKQVFSLGATKTITLPPEFIKHGDFAPISIALELRSAQGDKIIIPSDPAIGGFHIEPLLIDKTEANMTAVAWCQKLEERVKRVEDKLKEFEDKGTPLVFEE